MLSSSYRLNVKPKLIISIFVGICLNGMIFSGLLFSQATALSSLTPGYTVTLVPEQMTFTGDVATRATCAQPVCSWFEDTSTGTIILGVAPASTYPIDWKGSSATAEIFLPDIYAPTLITLKLSWPDRDGKGLHSPERNRMGMITLDGQPLWGKRTTHLSTFNNNYYAAEHEPILTTFVLTQSITHTLHFSVSANTTWDLSQIELSAYPYPTKIRGIGYSPFRDCQFPNPAGIAQPSTEEIREDLFRLFHTTNAIRTYAATGVNAQIPGLANEIGLPVYAGAWLDYDFEDSAKLAADEAEIQALISLAKTTQLAGVIVGNEYYLRHRTGEAVNYLRQRIIQVKSNIPGNIPVTTAEIDNLIFNWNNEQAVNPLRINPAYRPIVDELDFALIHTYPFWNKLPIDGAAAYTVNRYKAIQVLIEREYPGQNKRVVIGEAGWPSAGGSQDAAVPSLDNQRRYMLEFLHLAEQEDVEYMYFDAFDELWKIEESGRVGQNWGYSYTDRTAKHYFYGVLLPSEQLFSNRVYLPIIIKRSAILARSYRPVDLKAANLSVRSPIQVNNSLATPVYTEWPMEPENFVPSGWMGDIENIDLYECDRTNPYSGEMAIRASFSPTGTLGWGGVYWQHPENNWGTVEGAGFDLDDATSLHFYARGEKGGERVKFLMGGIWDGNPDLADSQQPAVSTDVITLTNEWLPYTLDLRGRDLSRVIGGFAFVTDRCLSAGNPVTFYLDDIHYVSEGAPGAPAPTPTPETPYTFDVYRDGNIAGKHYVPSGWMGDIGNIQLDECWGTDPHTGSTAIRVTYTPGSNNLPYRLYLPIVFKNTAQSAGPQNNCSGPSCGWAGVYWQDPANNWGDRPGGYDLTGARALTFWAKGEKGREKIAFKVGGVGCESGSYPDSLCPVRVFDPAPTILTTTWQLFTVPLSADLDLSHLVSGFLLTTSEADNPNGDVFYLDDIQYLFNVDMSSSIFSTPPIPIGSGSSRTFDLAFGDADNDGDLDLALGNHGPSQVCWNNGDLTFDCENAFGRNVTFNVEWGDMNKDGYLDLVVANSRVNNPQPNLVCFNNRDHTFTCTNFSDCSGDDDQPCHTALGDVDGDGDLDIALGTRFLQDLIYFNDGKGAFPTTTTTCTDRGWDWDMDFGDVDNDDDLDLVVVGDSPDYVCINNGTGIFTETRWLTWRIDSTYSVALSDADGDGDLDIAAGESSMDANEIYLNDGRGNFPEKLLFEPIEEETWSLAWGDVDGDGDKDLALGNSSRPIVVYFNEPMTTSPGFTLTKPIFLGTDGYRSLSVAFGDVDGDCDLDLAVSRDGGQNVIYLNTSLRGCAYYLPVIMKYH